MLVIDGNRRVVSHQQLFLLSAPHALQKESERFPGLGLGGKARAVEEGSNY